MIMTDYSSTEIHYYLDDIQTLVITVLKLSVHIHSITHMVSCIVGVVWVWCSMQFQL